MNEAVRRFLPMVDFLEQVLGKNSEIVLHDFSDPDHAIVDIRNGIVSGRKVGGPATDLALKIMHDAKYRDLPFITGYEGRGAGGKTLESATYFIRENDEIVGMLCVNTDLSTVRSINAMAQQLMACFDAAPTRTEPASIEVESLSESTQELIDRSIAELLSARGLDVTSLGQSDRVDVIRHLNGNGVFMLKGAVACAATALGISEPSVYRYLQKVRKEGERAKWSAAPQAIRHLTKDPAARTRCRVFLHVMFSCCQHLRGRRRPRSRPDRQPEGRQPGRRCARETGPRTWRRRSRSRRRSRRCRPGRPWS